MKKMLVVSEDCCKSKYPETYLDFMTFIKKSKPGERRFYDYEKYVRVVSFDDDGRLDKKAYQVEHVIWVMRVKDGFIAEVREKGYEGNLYREHYFFPKKPILPVEAQRTDWWTVARAMIEQGVYEDCSMYKWHLSDSLEELERETIEDFLKRKFKYWFFEFENSHTLSSEAISDIVGDTGISLSNKYGDCGCLDDVVGLVWGGKRLFAVDLEKGLCLLDKSKYVF